MIRNLYHYLLAWSGSIRYRHPSRNLFAIGVTGTKGKSTTIELLSAVLEASGAKTAVLSSLRSPSSNTMPGRWTIQKFLRGAVDAGAKYALIEVTSEGVRQWRHQFIDWDAAVFLNLQPEHLESHGSFENYRAAKVSFFTSLSHSSKNVRRFFINGDDKSAGFFKEAAQSVPNGKIIVWKEANARAMIQELRKVSDADWLKADFNVSNVAAALAVARELGIGDATVKEALEKFEGVPGRMQFVRRRPFAVVVDYAHTPDSLGAVYRNLREAYGFGDGSRLIAVLGSAGGGRDKWKRPVMGNIAARSADIVILTSEDPYDESPEAIIREMRGGMDGAKADVREVVDRREAIKTALSLARSGDCVVLTGMGSQKLFHEKNGATIPWNEVGIVQELLQEK